MKFQLLTLLTVALLFISCGEHDVEVAKRTEADRVADSLQAVADSIAMMRNIHSMQTGKHFHQDKDLAAVAHQDPKQKVRFKRAQYDGVEAKKMATEKRNEQLKKQMNELKDTQNNEL